jgi:hypothetical protein
MEKYLAAVAQSGLDSPAAVAAFYEASLFIICITDKETGKPMPYAREWQDMHLPGMLITVTGSAEQVKAMGDFLIAMPANGENLLRLMANWPQWSVLMLSPQGAGQRLMPDHLHYYRTAKPV